MAEVAPLVWWVAGANPGGLVMKNVGLPISLAAHLPLLALFWFPDCVTWPSPVGDLAPQNELFVHPLEAEVR